jgi:hypothetical protein
MKLFKTIIEMICGIIILFLLFFFDANPVIWVMVIALFMLFGGNKLKKYLP